MRKLTHPEMGFVIDKVGGNTIQKGDGHIGGKLFVCRRGMTPQTKISVNDKHWTMLGLNAPTSDPVMCIIIFTGKHELAVAETEIDIFV